ncbi:MAG: S-layer homology domain-containing protein [Clostridia bacterium]|nr:S-layer homology domain-containing protein [Clostridia bacterium]
MRKKTLFLSLCALICALLTIPMANALLTPGMDVLENELAFIKSSVANNDITFCEEDFINSIGAKRIESVTVLSLPDEASGSLRLGDTGVYVNQTIDRKNIGMLVFRPCTDVIASTAFDVRVNTGKEEYDITCTLRMTEIMNATPVIATDDLSVRTRSNVTYYGRLTATDPDKDTLNFEIASAPKHGSVSVTDPVGGSFKYTPTEGYAGKDSFTYHVRDEYGNYSETSKVSVTVEKNSGGVYYCDMKYSWAHNDAITLAEEGIMVGSSIGGQMVFGPDYRVSRAEFLCMAMEVCKIEADGTLTRTYFTDNDDIPSHLMSYVATAKKLGYIEGTKTEEGVFFYPNNTITRAEAAVIINKMLYLKTSGTV